MSGRYKVAWLCEALLVSRSGHYDWVERRRQPRPRASRACICESASGRSLRAVASQILSTRGEWIYAALPNGLRGWIPANSAKRVRF
ncbi:MAG: hypothetical protein ACR2ID_10590 [Chthoniobacterales bacterium]